MKIAVTYDNENKEVFQHFGRTQFFKVYDVEDGQVTSSEIIGSNGTGMARWQIFWRISPLMC